MPTFVLASRRLYVLFYFLFLQRLYFDFISGFYIIKCKYQKESKTEQKVKRHKYQISLPKKSGTNFFSYPNSIFVGILLTFFLMKRDLLSKMLRRRCEARVVFYSIEKQEEYQF